MRTLMDNNILKCIEKVRTFVLKNYLSYENEHYTSDIHIPKPWQSLE